MNRFIKTTLAAATLAIAGMGISVSNASAGDVEFNIRIGTAPVVTGQAREEWRGGRHMDDIRQVETRDWNRGHRGWDGDGHRNWDDGRRGWDGDRRHGWNRDRQRGFCSPQNALAKARWMGIHRARVTEVNRHAVEVRGRKHGHRVSAVFANDRRCSVIAAR